MADAENELKLVIGKLIWATRQKGIRGLAKRVFRSHGFLGNFGGPSSHGVLLASAQKDVDWESSPLLDAARRPFRETLMDIATLSGKTNHPHEMQGGNSCP